MAESPEAMRKALNELASLPTIEVKTAAVLFGVGVQSAYVAARSGRFGAIKLGAQYRFPSAIVRDALGLPHPITALDPTQAGDDTS